MDDKTDSLDVLLRRALQAQIDLGLDEVILAKPSATSADHSQAASDDLFGKTTGLPAAVYASLDDHRRDICNCQLCPLGQTRNKFVYGVGNPKAGIIFIGEAPGADEDRLGDPFVGRAGHLLDKILAAINFTRQDVYIANILKCRPPENRDPQPDEMEKCFPYLREQMAIIRPKLICALGRIAAQALLHTKVPVTKLRGEWHQYEGIPLLVTYHPAALLRDPSYKRGAWDDVQLLRAEYDRLAS